VGSLPDGVGALHAENEKGKIFLGRIYIILNLEVGRKSMSLQSLMAWGRREDLSSLLYTPMLILS
jgi:hypothetical protein